MNDKKLLNTREIARFLDINEKMVYAMITEKGLPATKVMGKWLFPRHLVEEWIESNTINHPQNYNTSTYNGPLIISGSNDILLNKAMDIFNIQYSDYTVVFGNIGSNAGILGLKKNLCHIASSHLLQKGIDEYNFEFADHELEHKPALINFCYRQQGLIVQKGNPKGIKTISDLADNNITFINRTEGSGTRLLFDTEIEKAGIKPSQINGYNNEVKQHLDVGIEVISGRADVGLGIKAVAKIMNLDFIPIKWERFDLLISKNRFFERGVQLFLGILHEKTFLETAEKLEGYDLQICGKMVFPKDAKKSE